MPKRIALRLVNFVWYSIALLLVLVAVLVTTGREVLPRIDFTNKKLTSYISKHTGADIQTTDFYCQWTQLYPEFHAKQILISTPALQVQLDNVKMDVNILRSLLQKTLVLDQLHLTQANIRYNPQPSATPQNTNPQPAPDLEKIWHAVNLLLSDVYIKDANAEWQAGEKSYTIHLNDFRVEQTLSGKKFFLRLLDKQGTQNLYATGELQGSTLKNSTGKLYVQTEGWQIDDWISLPIRQHIKHGEVWLDWNGLDAANIITRLDIEPQTKPDSTFSVPESVHAELSAVWKKSGTNIINIHSLATTDQQKSQQLLVDTRISIDSEKPALWRLQTPSLALDGIATTTPYLPAGDLKELFTSLNPQGHLRNVDLQWDNSKPLTERMQLRANADNINSGAWHGVPAFTQVSGYLQSGIGYGFIDLDSHNGFSMFYPTIYHAAMQFQHATGRVQWHWQPENNTVLVGSDYASLSGEAGEARGNFWLNIPTNHTPGDMYLAIGLRNSEARYRDTFLPYILPANLLTWLKNSIGDAVLPHAGFIYRGPLSEIKPHASSIQFYANIQNGHLQFDPAWPALTQLNATLLVDDSNAIVRADSGKIYNTAIQGAYVEVHSQDPGLSININARSRGNAEDGLRILQETPLKTIMGTAAEQWRMPQGILSTGLQLQIPLAGAKINAEEDVRLAFSDAQLAMKDFRLDFKKINGDISYSNVKGLNAPALKATLFDKPVLLDIASEKTAKNLTINISAKGSANTSDIANWSQMKALQLLEGSLDYNANLKLGPFDNQPSSTQPSASLGQLQITSDMKPVALALPPPFTKQRGEQKPFSLTVDLLQNNRQNYQLEYNKQVSGFFGIQNGKLLGGELVLLGETAKMPSPKDNLLHSTFQIRGTLPSGDLQQWIDLIAAYNKLPDIPPTKTASNNNIDSTAGNDAFYPSLSLTFNNANWKDFSFPKLQLYAGHENAAWEIYFDSGHARGNAFFYDYQRVPDIALSELKFYRASNTSTPTDSKKTLVSDVNFADIPSLNIRIDHLIVDDMDIGSISTELRSSENALRLEKLLATGNGYQLRDGSGTTGSTLIWRRNNDGSYQSEFHGFLHMQGKQPALTHLGIDVFILGESIDLYADVAWPGSPQQITAVSMNGSIYTRGKNGKYLQAKPNTAMRALGIINVATWARRLQLDFSDLSNDGISFDEYKGKLDFNQGVMKLSEPLEVKSPSSALALSGKALLDKETLDLQLVATLPVGNNATWIAALAGGLPAAAGVYVVSKVFDKQINNLTSLSYGITGPMSKPDIQFQRLAPLKSSPPKPTAKKSTAKSTGAPK